MLESMARTYGPGAVGVVLSGMGRDGATGAEAMIEAGGTMLVQDAASSVVWGMPGVIADAGLAHAVLPPDMIARRLGEWSAGAARTWR
jgi:two-component system chemotaxis response regulator CheB